MNPGRLRRFPACLPIVILLLLTLRLPAGADENSPPVQNRDLGFTQGIKAFEAGEYDIAFSRFQQAHLVDPENPEVLIYLVRSAIELRRYDRASTALKELAEIEDSADVQFYVAYIAYQEGRYREAVNGFQRAETMGSEIPTIPFFLGASLFRVADFDRARPLLEKSVRDLPETHPNSRFYLGATYLQQEEYTRAMRELRAVVDAEGDSRLGRTAANLLRQAERGNERTKWWEVSFELGSAYDSNVLYEPETDVVSGEEASYGFGSFEGVLYPYRTAQGHAGVGYALYQSIHFASDDDIVRDFDITRNAGSLTFMAHVLQGVPGVLTGLDYEYSDAHLGGVRYQQTHEIKPQATVIESDITATRAQVVVQDKTFPDFDGRDALYLRPTVSQLFSLYHRTINTAVELGYEQNEAESDLFDYQGVSVFVGAAIPVIGELSSILGLQGRFLDYVHHPDDRTDRRLIVDAGLKYGLTKYLSAHANYRHSRNDSNEDIFAWEKDVASLSVALEL
ncbi:MAG: tetratricopeptide repeat protein [Deltaproteobacteria bacterium]|nr:tetratricopeptide repeat protein [Deltaproteobacteria bacterium]MCB9478537.1 tetratricopeptide repeat protein [Deltaproteobacteria bacterium]